MILLRKYITATSKVNAVIYFNYVLTNQSTERDVQLLVAINTDCKDYKTKIVRCPECKARLCDYVLDDSKKFENFFSVISSNIKSQFIIKCNKCGRIIGIASK